MYIIEINGQYVQDISDGMPRFVFGKFGARQFLVVADAVSCHIYAHVGRRLIRAFAVDALEHGA